LEPFHLFRYMYEGTFRYNHRTDNDAGRFDRVASMVTGKRLTYTELTGANTTPA
jgi:hypothetical protein